MADTRSPAGVRSDFARTAREYLESLPPEHFMEGTDQAFQRSITLCTFRQIHDLRHDVQAFNELLVQYDHGRPPKRRGVVPDNMVCLCARQLDPKGSFDVPVQGVKPMLVMEYVSPSNQRKDYEDSYRKYEKELKIPYYLLFHAEQKELLLFRHDGKKYVSVVPDGRGRRSIPEMEVEVGLVGGWVRFWFRGEFVETSEQIVRKLEATSRKLGETSLKLDETSLKLDETSLKLDETNRKLDAAEKEIAELRRRLGGSCP